MNRLRAWNQSRVAAIGGSVLVIAFMGALLLTDHGELVIYIGAASGVASYILRRRRTHDTHATAE